MIIIYFLIGSGFIASAESREGYRNFIASPLFIVCAQDSFKPSIRVNRTFRQIIVLDKQRVY